MQVLLLLFCYSAPYPPWPPQVLPALNGVHDQVIQAITTFWNTFLLLIGLLFIYVLLPLFYVVNYFYNKDVAKMEEGLQHARSAKSQRGLVQVGW